MKFLYFLILSFVLICCNNDTHFDFIEKAIKSQNQTYDFKNHVIIIPNAGCLGCITVAEDFAKKHAGEDFYIIFTNISSLKLLKTKLGDVSTYPNIIYDTENIFFSFYDESIYPCIVYIEEGEVNKIEYQSVEFPDTFNKFETFLTDQL